MPNLFKAFVEGLGSKRLAASLASVAAVFIAIALKKWLGLEVGIEELVLLLTPGVLFVLSQWHLDKATGGQTSTAFRLFHASAMTVEKLAKDGTVVDQLARAVMKALQDAEPPGAAPAEPGTPLPLVEPSVQPVPPAPPAQP